MIKMIVTDVDGTLVKDGTHDINPEYFDVIKKLIEKGIKVVIASGRSYSSASQLFGELADKLYFICDGGTMIRTSYEMLKIYPMEEELWKGIYRSAKTLPGIDICISTEKGGYAEDTDSQMYHWLVDSYKFNMSGIRDIDEITENVVKISVYHPEDCEAVCRDSFIPMWNGKAKLASAGSAWMDCVNKDADKGTALQWLQQYLGVQKEETMAFGDNINDMEMLQNAGQGYAVGNAREELKSVADEVIKPYWEYGVLEVMKTFIQR